MGNFVINQVLGGKIFSTFKHAVIVFAFIHIAFDFQLLGHHLHEVVVEILRKIHVCVAKSLESYDAYIGLRAEHFSHDVGNGLRVRQFVVGVKTYGNIVVCGIVDEYLPCFICKGGSSRAHRIAVLYAESFPDEFIEEGLGTAFRGAAHVVLVDDDDYLDVGIILHGDRFELLPQEREGGFIHAGEYENPGDSVSHERSVKKFFVFLVGKDVNPSQLFARQETGQEQRCQHQKGNEGGKRI